MIVSGLAPSARAASTYDSSRSADHVVADHTEVQRDVDDRDRDRGREDSLPDAVREQERDHDREQQERKDEQRVHDQDEHPVELAAEVAGEQPERHADADGEEERR